MFNIDFNKLITWLIPPMLRQTIYFAWMQALCAPVVAMYDLFMTNRTAELYQLNHDSRVFSMQAVFNDAFDSISRRIVITDGLNLAALYIYTREEAQPLWLYTRAEAEPVYIYNRGDYVNGAYDFIVWVPTAITMSATQLIQLAGLVNLYKLASKRYVIYEASPPG